VDLSYSTGNIFPVPIHVFDIKDFNLYQKDLIDYAYTLKSKDPEDSKGSNYGIESSITHTIEDGNLRLSLLMMEVINYTVF